MSITRLNTINLLAPAKINLFLHLTGKRDDGYHLLQSLMIFVDVGDRLEIAPYDGLFIDVDGPFAGDMSAPHDNLVYKAAVLLAEDYKMQPRGRITLEKNLPIASGVGGGASDAAAALTGLARLWGLPEEPDRLHRIAQKLGSDVPACLVRSPVWAEGTGDKMTRLPGMPDMHFVLVNPRKATPTSEVFRRFRRRFSAPIQFTGRRKTMHEWIADLKLYRNDLTDAATEICPDITVALQSIADTPNCHFARLSGSGSTCFGVYDNPAAAYAAVNKLRERHPDWWIAQANFLR
jgi:4-diphosphocytidyl-2-C-methyl-D-erythritol kinase